MSEWLVVMIGIPVAIICCTTNGVPSASPSAPVTLGATKTCGLKRRPNQDIKTYKREMGHRVDQTQLIDFFKDRFFCLKVSRFFGRVTNECHVQPNTPFARFGCTSY